MDDSIDRKFGTNTAGVVRMEELEFIARNKNKAVNYQATGRVIFSRMMSEILTSDLIS